MLNEWNLRPFNEEDSSLLKGTAAWIEQELMAGDPDSITEEKQDQIHPLLIAHKALLKKAQNSLKEEIASFAEHLHALTTVDGRLDECVYSSENESKDWQHHYLYHIEKVMTPRNATRTGDDDLMENVTRK